MRSSASRRPERRPLPGPRAARLAGELRALAARFGTQLRRTRGNAGEDAVHDLRVLARRLRAVLRVAKPLPASAPARRAARRLRRLGRALGERRMWDVAIAGMRALRADPARFEPQREAAARALDRELERLHHKRLARELGDSHDLLSAASDAVVAARARRLRAFFSAAIVRPPTGWETRHALRIRLKKARYLLEACGIAATAARRLQDLLGAEHDLRVLQEIAGPVVRARAMEARARAGVDRILRPSLRKVVAGLSRLEQPGKTTARRAARRP